MAIVEPDPNIATRTTSAAPRPTSRAKLVLIGGDLFLAGFALIGLGTFTDPGTDSAIASLTALAAWAFWLSRARLYSARFITRRADEIRRTARAAVATLATVGLTAYTFELSVARDWLLGAVGVGFVLITLERELVRRRFDRRRRNGELRRRVLVIGDNAEAREFTAMFEEDASLGYDVAETIDPSDIADAKELTTTVLQQTRGHQASGVVVAASAMEHKASNRLIRDLIDAGIHVELSSTLADIAPGRLTVRPLGRFPVVYVEPVQRAGWRGAAKRAFDFTLALSAIILGAPVLLGVALAIKLDDRGGPVLFKQTRVGQNGVPFGVYKFRTMVSNAEELLAELQADNEGAGPLFKMKDDPRITRVGRFLRKTSLDELAQLFNVVAGSMSLVGPRPALPAEMAEWGDDLYGRLRVKPGITGMWQVSGRSETTFEEYTRLDLYYVDNWSLVIDLAIIAKTIPAVLKSDGAY